MLLRSQADLLDPRRWARAIASRLGSSRVPADAAHGRAAARSNQASSQLPGAGEQAAAARPSPQIAAEV